LKILIGPADAGKIYWDSPASPVEDEASSSHLLPESAGRWNLSSLANSIPSHSNPIGQNLKLHGFIIYFKKIYIYIFFNDAIGVWCQLRQLCQIGNGVTVEEEGKDWKGPP